MKRIYLFLTLALLLASCGNDRTLTSATGTIYECLVVMPNRPLSQSMLDSIATLPDYRETGNPYATPISTTYDLVSRVMGADMPCLPQMEPYFALTQVPVAQFDDFLKPTRNILIVDINPDKYTVVKAKAGTDQWSHPQAVYHIQAPSDEAFTAYWLNHGTEVRDWFVRQELARQITFYRANTNKDARIHMRESFGCDMLIPEDYMFLMDTTLYLTSSDSVQLLWCCNNKGSLRRDIVVYSYPYTDSLTFTPEYLNARRDSILGHVITASVQGTYMSTEYDVFPPQYRSVLSLQPTDGFYAAEIRGLWKIRGGQSFGGPYVSLTRLDQVQGRVVTAETFIFASGQKKRNALRQSEAILYTLQLPQELVTK